MRIGRIMSKAAPHGIRQQTVHKADLDKKPLAPLCGQKLRPGVGAHASIVSGWIPETIRDERRPRCSRCWRGAWA